jgi:hypothetical protein
MSVDSLALCLWYLSMSSVHFHSRDACETLPRQAVMRMWGQLPGHRSGLSSHSFS